MINKSIKFIITFVLTVCVLCCSFTIAFAAPEGTTKVITTEEQLVVTPETEEEPEEEAVGGLIVGAPTTEEAEETEETQPTQPQTTKPQTTREPVTKPVTTTRKPQVNNNAQNVPERVEPERNEQVNAPVEETEATETTESTLPEGSFYVYLELNNGQRRLKRVLDKPGLVPEPNEPVREGYIFDGWYADAKLTKPWNFFSSVADEKTVIYAKWVSDGSLIEYKVKIAKTVGGTIEVNPVSASEGEPVIITVLPEEGKRIVSGSLKINGKSSDVFSFIMPAKDVVIEAQFENIPEGEVQEAEEKKSIAPFIIGGIIVVVAILAVVFVILKRRAEFAEPVELDENGAIIIEDDDEDDWVDDSIVIEDGFSNGKIVKENIEPDFSQPEDDELM